MAEMETTEPAKLGRGNLRLADVVAQAVGFMGPVFSVTFFLTAIGGASLTGKGAGINIADLADPRRDRHGRRLVDHLALREAHPRGGVAVRLRDARRSGAGRASSQGGSTTAE